MSEAPHHAGSPGSKAVAEYVLEKHRSWGIDAWTEEFNVLLPTPIRRNVELLGQEGYVARLQETVFPEDKDASDVGQLPTFNAFSAAGDVTGELVSVNYGLPGITRRWSGWASMSPTGSSSRSRVGAGAA